MSEKWRCGCGELNDSEDTNCHECGEYKPDEYADGDDFGGWDEHTY